MVGSVGFMKYMYFKEGIEREKRWGNDVYQRFPGAQDRMEKGMGVVRR